jgi:hypothetical protein
LDGFGAQPHLQDPRDRAVFAKTFGAQMQPGETIKTLYLISALPE